jgi:Domain of unknown function (DUF4388)
VSLEGTLETIALPDVLALLSVTAKTGELRLESDAGVGRIWLDAGLVAGFDVGGQHSAVDALFALLRWQDGSFRFHTGTEPLNPVEPQEVAPVMEEAEERLSQWPEISAVVPSLSSKLDLQASVHEDVILSPDQWGLIALIGSGRSVEEVLNGRGLGEFDGCKAVKELVELGLVQVDHVEVPDEEVAVTPGPADEDSALTQDGLPVAEFGDEDKTSNGWSEAELDSLSEVWNDETGQVQSAPADEDQPESGQPVNRGLLLKFLGSARS